MKIVASKNFRLNGKTYIKGDTVEVSNIREVIKLNEGGFIEPLYSKDYEKIKKELENKTANVVETEKGGK